MIDLKILFTGLVLFAPAPEPVTTAHYRVLLLSGKGHVPHAATLVIKKNQVDWGLSDSGGFTYGPDNTVRWTIQSLQLPKATPTGMPTMATTTPSILPIRGADGKERGRLRDSLQDAVSSEVHLYGGSIRGVKGGKYQYWVGEDSLGLPLIDNYSVSGEWAGSVPSDPIQLIVNGRKVTLKTGSRAIDIVNLPPLPPPPPAGPPPKKHGDKLAHWDSVTKVLEGSHFTPVVFDPTFGLNRLLLDVDPTECRVLRIEGN